VLKVTSWGNEMRYIEFNKSMRSFTVFSLNDIKKIDKNFHRRRLNEWQNKGYIKKVIRGYYIFSDLALNENILFEIANRIYNPSYISLEMAFSYYHLIPESVYGITSVSTRRTYRFRTSVGEFIYRKIKPNLFFGYNLISYKGKRFKVASIEKAILDYFYINPNTKTEIDFASLRMNKDSFLRQINEKELYKFLKEFDQKTLTRKVDSFLEFMKND
jgi:predicted transcriptional regulator of viral defense system